MNDSSNPNEATSIEGTSIDPNSIEAKSIKMDKFDSKSIDADVIELISIESTPVKEFIADPTIATQGDSYVELIEQWVREAGLDVARFSPFVLKCGCVYYFPLSQRIMFEDASDVRYNQSPWHFLALAYVVEWS